MVALLSGIVMFLRLYCLFVNKLLSSVLTITIDCADAVEFLQGQGVPATYPTLSGMARLNKGPAITRVWPFPFTTR
jgi:hypothetical protein